MRRAYWLKRPGRGGRATFAIVAPNGKQIDDPRLYALNQFLLAGMSHLDVEKQVLLIVKELNAEAQPEEILRDCHPDNAKLLDLYWKEEYGRRPRKDERSARNRLHRAVKSVGRLSLIAAPINELQDAIFSLAAQQQKPRAAALNQLLRWARRPEKLYYQPPAEPEPASISLAELEQLCRSAPPDRAALFRVAFATGARAGELFAPWFGPFKDGKFHYVRISKQWVFEREAFGPRKWGKQATPRIVPELRVFVSSWKPVSELQSTERSRWVKEAAIAAGLDPNLTFHNFRHSYARYWSEKGASLTDLSLWLGDNYAVVEKYYRGWQLRVTG